MKSIIKVIISSLRIHMDQSFARQTFKYVILLQPILYSTLLYFMFKSSDEVNVGEYIVVGTGIISLWSSIIFSSAGDIERERYMGTLETLIATPSNFIVIFFGKILGNIILGIFSMFSSLICVTMIFGLNVKIESLSAFSLAFLLTILSFSIISLLMASLFTLSRNSRMLMNCMEYPIYILCGIIFPISLLPSFFQYISLMLIPTWSVKLMRSSMTGIDNYNIFFSEVLIFSILSILYLILALYLFKFINYKTKIKGDLGVY
ncbi:ABC transporter permease [Sutcliffiella horikoshii]|uniref:ABC transporter permease n=1 Tax=Sutcliffiella horikoshii TaxID=79883 RepID=UPI003CEBDC57